MDDMIRVSPCCNTTISKVSFSFYEDGSSFGSCLVCGAVFNNPGEAVCGVRIPTSEAHKNDMFWRERNRRPEDDILEGRGRFYSLRWK